MGSPWKTVRVFVSSTFRDMHAERDHLVKVTFPRLRQWCEERRLHLVDIDLRWGVTREEAENGKALEICLESVDRSRPFFLCLLGERYGWSPGGVSTGKYQFRTEAEAGGAPRSITHWEIVHAVLDPAAARGAGEDPPPVCGQAFFYFRETGCVPSPERLPGWSDAERGEHRRAFFEDEAGRAGALEELKAMLRERFGPEDRVRDYRGDWDPGAGNPEEPLLRGRLRGLEAFGEMVERDLHRAIEAEYAGHLATLGNRADPFEDERGLHEAFLEQRLQAHTPRGEIEEQLIRYVKGEDPRPLVLTGPPGSGKSAILAHWVDGHVDRGSGAVRGMEGAVAVCRFVGASPASGNVAGVLGSVWEELRRRLRLDGEVPVDPGEVLRKWPDALREAGARARIVVIVDAVDQWEGGRGSRGGDWIPDPLPGGVRIILSTLDRETGSGEGGMSAEGPRGVLRELRGRGIVEVAVPELTEAERREIIRSLPSVFGKSLDEEQMDLLLKNPASRSPLFLTVALQELRVFGSFGGLREAIASLPGAGMDGMETGEGAGGALEELWGRVLDRLDEEASRLTPGMVPKLFALLVSGRDGLAEAELEGLLERAFPRLSRETIAGAMQAALRQVRPYLQRKQSQGMVLLDFFHRSFREAVAAKYLREEGARVARHVEIAGYFEAQEYFPAPGGGTEPREVAGGVSGRVRRVNVRKTVELPWQRIQAAKVAGGGNEASAHWDAVADLLCDWRFLEAKNEALAR